MWMALPFDLDLDVFRIDRRSGGSRLDGDLFLLLCRRDNTHPAVEIFDRKRDLLRRFELLLEALGKGS